MAADGDHGDRARARRQRAARVRQRRRQAGAAADRARQRHKPAAAQLRGASPLSGEPGGRCCAVWGGAALLTRTAAKRGDGDGPWRSHDADAGCGHAHGRPQRRSQQPVGGRSGARPTGTLRAARPHTKPRPQSQSAQGPAARQAEARAHPGALALEAGDEPALLAAGQPVGRAGRLLAVAQLQLHARAQCRRRRRLRPHDRAARRGRLHACAAAGAGCWSACARCWPASAGEESRRGGWLRAVAGATSAAPRRAEAVRAGGAAARQRRSSRATRQGCTRRARETS